MTKTMKQCMDEYMTRYWVINAQQGSLSNIVEAKEWFEQVPTMDIPNALKVEAGKLLNSLNDTRKGVGLVNQDDYEGC